MSAMVKHMQRHIINCEKISRGWGRMLLEDNVLVEDLERQSEGAQALRSMAQQLQAKVYPHYSKDERDALDRSFARAMHESGAEFGMFDHTAWKNFFDLLHLPWSPPSSSELSTTLLSSCYNDVMLDVARALRESPAVTLGVDGATNVLSRSLSNVIAHDPRPWFVEYLRADLKKESEPEVTKKVEESITRMHTYLDRPVVFAFVSDSCNLMRAVRKSLQDHNSVAFAYGCGAHALNNFCEDIVKNPGVKAFVRNTVYLSKIVKNTGLLNKIFSSLCFDFLQRQYTMVLYSASRWSSVNYMFQRLAKVKRPMTAVVTAVMNEKVERNIDPSYQLPSEFTSIVMDPQFWGNVSWHVKVFDPICKCIGVMESNSATMSTA
ncbi:hypothetical protein GN958_ATG05570 [Phytophthora infestans]|uniref:DUF659 domain-containing protein n=2 Tax=Phytophthora infestans TaxID=4787 RepID=A0A8S9UVZ5_PHYIN|nr:hypothetical protein GN958_ATG05570 [Phytophthora infestans]